VNNALVELAHILATARAARVRCELAAQRQSDPGSCPTEAANASENPAATETLTDANKFYQTAS
jgi:hypothetical protein